MNRAHTGRVVSVVGCGWYGRPLAMQLRDDGWRVKGSKTTREGVSALRADGIDAHLLCLDPFPAGDVDEALFDAEVLILNIPPGRRPDVERFYTEHIRKLLAVRGASRYLAKGNYNVLRFPYLQSLFTDLRLLVPFRNPVHHIASLLKQHRYFMRHHQDDPRIGRHLALSGHFEFGPYRKAMHFGNDTAWEAIENAWQAGREVEGWALYWASTYQHLLDQAQKEIGEACRLFSYEELCRDSAGVIDTILEHCHLEREPFRAVRKEYISKLSLPAYYQPDFSPLELEIIEQHCAPVLQALKEHSQP